MRPRRAGLALAAALLLPLSAAAQPSATRPTDQLDARKLASITEWLKGDVERGRIPGAVVLVAKDGKIALFEAVGWADRERKVLMAKDAIFPIASSTKLITTIAALRLYEANKLRLMAPIASYLPELKDLKVAVEKRDAAGNVTTELVSPPRQPTVHDLMTHRAGFTYFFIPPRNALRDRYKELGIDRMDTMTADETLQKLATLPLAYPPGTQFEYSIATDLLGHIIERITKKPLDTALQELVLGPLRMRDTSFVVAGPGLARLARPLATDPDPWVFEWIDVTRAPKRFSGGAGLASTASDYLKALQLLLNGGELDGVRLLSPATVRWAMADQAGNVRGPFHPGDGYSWNLFNPVRISDVGTMFPGDVGDVFWGGITGPRYFLDPKERLAGILFLLAPSQRASYHAELRAMVYGALAPAGASTQASSQGPSKPLAAKK